MIALVIVLWVALTSGEPVCNESTFVQVTFAACVGNERCFRNLNPHAEEMKFFEFLLHTELLQPLSLSVATVCAEDAFPLWIALMADHSFCNPNHILDSQHGCMCLSDKQCQELNPSEFQLGEFGKSMLVVLFIAIVLFMGFKVLKAIANVHSPLQQQQQPTITRKSVTRTH